MGGIKFAPDEILRLAVKIEANGGNFYRKVLSLYKDKDIKELFNTLAEDEDRHKGFFEDILNSVEDRDYLNIYNDSEYQNYIDAMANEVVFTQATMVKRLEEGFKSIEEVFDFALGLEEDSILFYSELKGSILKDKSYLSTIINEERKHFSSLSELKSKYLKRR